MMKSSKNILLMSLLSLVTQESLYAMNLEDLLYTDPELAQIKLEKAKSEIVEVTSYPRHKKKLHVNGSFVYRVKNSTIKTCEHYGTSKFTQQPSMGIVDTTKHMNIYNEYPFASNLIKASQAFSQATLDNIVCVENNVLSSIIMLMKEENDNRIYQVTTQSK